MTAKFLSIVLLIVGSGASGSEKTEPELKAQIFRFVRIEDLTLTPGYPIPVAVFAFLYSHPRPLKFWGFDPPNGKKFIADFTHYRVREKSGWQDLPRGYCGTGAMTYILKPGVDYELLIVVGDSDADGSQLRVSAESLGGRFWSAPFTLPKK